jgi:hypothetical protein
MNRIIRMPDGSSEIDFDITLKQYRKRPVVVFAARLAEPCEIETLEGTMRGNAGDYLIRGVKGEYYPCKPDIFEATYEALPDDRRQLTKVEPKAATP